MQVLAEDAVGNQDQQVPVPIQRIILNPICTENWRTPYNRVHKDPTDQNSEPVVTQLDMNIMCIYTYIYIDR